MRTHFLLLVAFLAYSSPATAQRDAVVALPSPGERIQTRFCATSGKPSCTQQQLEDQMLPVLQKYLKRLPVDTLKLRLQFTVSPEGKRDRTEILLNLGNSVLAQKIEKKLERALQAVEPYKVLHHNPGAYPSWHRFKYHYMVLKRENLLKPVEVPENYAGGVVLKVPRFPQCPGEGDLQDRKCFQEQMREHIKTHFRYPEAAIRNGIQGVVYTMFNIGEDGAINSLRLRGPNPLLTEEAARIISLLPRFHPATENGNPVSIPFSIPITFRLHAMD